MQRTRLHRSPHPAAVDSRQVVPGGLFAAVRGGRVDGHNFAPHAFAQGPHPSWHSRSVSGPAIVVSDVVAALGALARYVLATSAIMNSEPAGQRPAEATKARSRPKSGRRPRLRDRHGQPHTGRHHRHIAMFAIAAHAEREAHLHEVERFGQTLPVGSYGRQTARPSPPARQA